MNRPFRDGGTIAEPASASPASTGIDTAVVSLPSHPEAVSVQPGAELYRLKSDGPGLPWSVRLAGAALAGLAVFLLCVALT